MNLQEQVRMLNRIQRLQEDMKSLTARFEELAKELQALKEKPRQVLRLPRHGGKDN